MVELEYEGVKINVPQSWEDIKLGFYETFYKVKPVSARERIAFVATVCKVEPETMLSWPAEVFDTIVGYVGFLFEDNPRPASPYITVDGVKYIVPIEEVLTLGAWVDADEAQKAETAVLSTVLAIVCRPAGETYDYNNNEKRAAMFAALPVSEVLGVLAFFLQCVNVLRSRTAAYSNLLLLADQLPRNIRSFLNPGGGIRLSRIYAITRYYVLMILLRYRLQKFSRTYNTEKIKTRRKTPSVS